LFPKTKEPYGLKSSEDEQCRSEKRMRLYLRGVRELIVSRFIMRYQARHRIEELKSTLPMTLKNDR
jgi:hypothetical protein